MKAKLLKAELHRRSAICHTADGTFRLAYEFREHQFTPEIQHRPAGQPKPAPAVHPERPAKHLTVTVLPANFRLPAIS
jgi:hypothetical protein